MGVGVFCQLRRPCLLRPSYPPRHRLLLFVFDAGADMVEGLTASGGRAGTLGSYWQRLPFLPPFPRALLPGGAPPSLRPPLLFPRPISTNLLPLCLAGGGGRSVRRALGRQTDGAPMTVGEQKGTKVPSLPPTPRHGSVTHGVEGRELAALAEGEGGLGGWVGVGSPAWRNQGGAWLRLWRPVRWAAESWSHPRHPAPPPLHPSSSAPLFCTIVRARGVCSVWMPWLAAGAVAAARRAHAQPRAASGGASRTAPRPQLAMSLPCRQPQRDLPPPNALVPAVAVRASTSAAVL